MKIQSGLLRQRMGRMGDCNGQQGKGFGQSRIVALEYWYELEGWKKPAYLT